MKLLDAEHILLLTLWLHGPRTMAASWPPGRALVRAGLAEAAPSWRRGHRRLSLTRAGEDLALGR